MDSSLILISFTLTSSFQALLILILQIRDLFPLAAQQSLESLNEFQERGGSGVVDALQAVFEPEATVGNAYCIGKKPYMYI